MAEDCVIGDDSSSISSFIKRYKVTLLFYELGFWNLCMGIDPCIYPLGRVSVGNVILMIFVQKRAKKTHL